MKKIKSIIIDDEELARFEVKYLLNDFPMVEVVGEAESLDEACRLIEIYNPELIFLDIQLGNETGFDLFKKTNIQSSVIFITAYEQFAIRAFEVNALDYLLKPVNPDRLKESLMRIINSENFDKKNNNFAALNYDDRVYINSNGKLKFVEVKLIKCINAFGDYSKVLNSENKEFVVLKSLKNWEGILPNNYFNRIHRSTIINNSYINKIEPWSNYTYKVFLTDVVEPLSISRRYASKLKSLINGQ